MASFNGEIASLIKGSSTGGENAVLTGVSYITLNDAVPNAHFEDVLFGVVTSGVSGTYAVYIVESVAGCTAIVAGETSISTDGSNILGSTTPVAASTRPAYVAFASAEDGCGFTASVTMAARY